MVHSYMERNFTNLLDYGRYFVPAREHQIETVCDLIPASNHPFTVFELCCGEGLLVKLSSHNFSKGLRTRRFSQMLQQAQMRLTQYKDRFHSVQFDLAALDLASFISSSGSYLPSNPSFGRAISNNSFTTFTSC